MRKNPVLGMDPWLKHVAAYIFCGGRMTKLLFQKDGRMQYIYNAI